MLNNQSKIWDEKYKKSREYSSVEDFFVYSKSNPSVVAIEPFIKDGISILEIGSGTGELISYISHKYPNTNTFGIDFSEESVRKSTEVAQKFKIKTVFSRADIKKMNFPDQKFDIVFGDQVIGHVDDVDLAMKEIYRITKDGGIIALTISNKLRPDGWFLNKKLSTKHEGYKQDSIFPWKLWLLLKKYKFKPLNLYGDMLFLFRNLSLIKSVFKKGDTMNASSAKSINKVKEISTSKSFIKSSYLFLDKSAPSWLKVTIGIIAKK